MLRLLKARGLARGVLGGSRGWAVLWAVLTGVGLLRRWTRDKPEIVYSAPLREGEALVISGRDREPRVHGGSAHR